MQSGQENRSDVDPLVSKFYFPASNTQKDQRLKEMYHDNAPLA